MFPHVSIKFEDKDKILDFYNLMTVICISFLETTSYMYLYIVSGKFLYAQKSNRLVVFSLEKRGSHKRLIIFQD